MAGPSSRGGRAPGALRALTFAVGGESLVVVSFAIDAAARSAFDRLTPAEREVCEAVVRGESNAAIAASRRRSPRTIRNQLAAIFAKLGVGSRAELAALYAGGVVGGRTER